MIAMCVLYLMEKSRSGEVAIGGRGCHREIVSTRRSRDQEIAPTGEGVRGRSRSEEIVSTRRSRDQEIAPTGEVSGGGRDQEIAPTVRDGECVAIGGRGRDHRFYTKKSRSGDRYRGEGEVAIRRSLLQGKMSLKKNKAVEFPPPLCRLVHIDLSLKHLCYSRDDFNSPQVVVALPAAPMCPLRRCARVRVWRFPSNETSSIW